MGMEPTILDRLGWHLCSPYTIPAWALFFISSWHILVSGRRELGIQVLWAAWFLLLILDLIALQVLLHALFTPSGCTLWSPRRALQELHVPQLALAIVSVPLLALSGRSPQAIWRQGAARVILAAAQVAVVSHLSLWFITTPEGRLPTAGSYLRLFTW